MDEFLESLEKQSYLKYALYTKEQMLFITLYDDEEMEKYIIIEAIDREKHPEILAALEKNKYNP